MVKHGIDAQFLSGSVKNVIPIRFEITQNRVLITIGCFLCFLLPWLCIVDVLLLSAESPGYTFQILVADPDAELRPLWYF